MKKTTLKKALSKVEGTKADTAHHKKGVKEGSKKDIKLDTALAKKMLAKKKK